jgi:GTP diphosphokinase / guanosine-3',5'-bis(diphosphate) 3'-diphosphatase
MNTSIQDYESVKKPAWYLYNDIDAVVEEIIEKVSKYMTVVPREHIRAELLKAYLFARDAHEGQFRKSWEPYISHPVAATRILTTLKPDIVTLQCCFLHDVPEDTCITKAEIEVVFWPAVAHIVSWMEKLSKVKYRGEDRTIGSMRKMFIAMSEDLRLILVKFADRIHNMQTLQFHPSKEKRDRIALETLNIYVPIADRLGIFDFKEMLETECFRILYPDDFNRIQNELAELQDKQLLFLENACKVLASLVPPGIVVYEISSRIKSPFSVFRKMQRKGLDSIAEIYDLFALRIITESVSNCYEFLWLIHNKYTPVPKRFKDYIALPKPNGYQSLHTTVFGLLPEFRRLPTEVQIRTVSMHRRAEIWVAAHFDYKERWSGAISKDVFWVQELKWLIEKLEDGDFMGEMKTNVFDDRIFVFTPKGAVINLPKDSTPVDFAYAVHSDLWNKLTIAKVNGKVVPVDTVLRNGDRVDIVTDKNKRPSVAWLSFVKTSRAKEVIRSEINREQREVLIIKGRAMLSTYLEKHYGTTLDKELSVLKRVDGRVLDMKWKEEILLQIGNLSRKPSSLIRSISAALPPPIADKKVMKLQEIPNEKPSQVHQDGIDEFGVIVIGGQKSIPHRMAACCSPKPWDRVVGYITKWVINIHKVGCSSIKKWSLDRLIPTSWANVWKEITRMRMEILVENRIGVLRILSNIFFHMEINIEEISQRTVNDWKDALLYLLLSVDEEDYYLYDRLVERMKMELKDFKEARLIEML